MEHREDKTNMEVSKADSNPICLPGNLICLVRNKMPEGGGVGWKNSTEKSKPASSEHHPTTLGCVDFEKLCDGIQDCVNGEDESFCQ